MRRSVRSKSDTIGIRIRSVSLIRIDTYRASGAENMIASSPLSRWVSIGEDEDGINATLGNPRGFPTFAAPALSFALRLAILYLAVLRLAYLLRRLVLLRSSYIGSSSSGLELSCIQIHTVAVNVENPVESNDFYR